MTSLTKKNRAISSLLCDDVTHQFCDSKMGAGANRGHIDVDDWMHLFQFSGNRQAHGWLYEWGLDYGGGSSWKRKYFVLVEDKLNSTLLSSGHSKFKFSSESFVVEDELSFSICNIQLTRTLEFVNLKLRCETEWNRQQRIECNKQKWVDALNQATAFHTGKRLSIIMPLLTNRF